MSGSKGFGGADFGVVFECLKGAMMPSGGARARSGPAPDPAALRRDRKDDKEWLSLPVDGFKGVVPSFPLPKILVYDTYWVDKKQVRELDEGATEIRWDSETSMWNELWSKPQAAMWDALGLKFQVAAYVRAYIESVGPDSNSGLKTAALRMEAELGLSTVGMNALRWKFSADEVGEKRAAPAKKGPTMKDRLRVVDGSV